MNNIKTCAFWYPSRQLGGAEMLLIRIVTALSARGIQCTLVDYADGFVVGELKRAHVQFNHIVCNESQWIMDSGPKLIRHVDALVVYQTHFMYLYKVRSLGHPKILVWEMNKGMWPEFTSKESSWCWRMIVVANWRRALNCIIGNSAFAVLENDSIRVMRECGIGLLVEPALIPIPIDIPATESNRGKGEDVVTIGRATEEKMVAAAWAFSRLNKLSQGRLRYRVLSDFPIDARAIVLAEAPELEHVVTFDSPRVGDALNEWLVEHARIYVGMGTTILEAAKLGIPSIVIDGNDKPYPDAARVRLYSDDDMVNLGRPWASVEEGYVLEDAYGKLDCNYVFHSNAVVRKVIQNHSADSVAIKLLDALNLSKLTLDFYLSRPAIVVGFLIDVVFFVRARVRRASVLIFKA